MDAWEFFNTLLDKLENELRGTNSLISMRKIFGGNLTNQLIGVQGCDHKREREEPFYTISVDIKQKENLESALELFVQGEMLTGENKYMCESCGEPVSTLKRCCIKDLPHMLVIHLKRFEFDYDTLDRKKVSSPCSFPMLLNMEPYTAEGLARKEAEKAGSDFDKTLIKPASYYEYELVGTVVHTGGIDSGHYYSFIKERIPIKGNSLRWFEFNDTNVRLFDQSEIPEETFGGIVDVEILDKETNTKKVVKKEKSNNAYLLFYQRVTPLQIPEEVKLESPKSARGHSSPKHKQKTKRSTQVREIESKEKVRDKESKPKKSSEGDLENMDQEPNGEIENKKTEEPNVQNNETTKSDSKRKEEGEVEEKKMKKEKEGVPKDTLQDIKEPKKRLHKTKKVLPVHTASPTSRIKWNASGIIDPKLEEDTSITSIIAKSYLKNLYNAKSRISSNLNKMFSEQWKVGIPENIFRLVWAQNVDYLFDRQIFDSDFFGFVWRVLNLYSPKQSKLDGEGSTYSPSLHMIQYGTKFLFQVYSYCRDKDSFVMWAARLKSYYQVNPDACRWLLTLLLNNRELVETLLYSEKSKLALCEVIVTAISSLAPHERHLYPVTSKWIKSNDTNKQISTEGLSCSMLFINLLLSRLLEKYVQRSVTDQYFNCFIAFSVGVPEIHYLLYECSLIQVFSRLLRGTGEFAYENTTSPTQWSSRFSAAIDVIAHLFCATKIGSTPSRPPTATLPFDDMLELPEKDFKLIFHKAQKFLHPIIQADINSKAIIRMGKHHSWESLENTSEFWFKSIIATGFTTVSPKSAAVKPYMLLFKGILEIDDTLSIKRTDDAVEFFLNLLKEHLSEKDSETSEKLVNVLGKFLDMDRFKQSILKKDYRTQLMNYLSSAGVVLTKPS
eukprot:TRINITY_DN7826_c0_g2_i4.p1 TRINITY_DN7826_c0_g2~~TRINITY_DN7826_c0_g2_i4.p1  ORF type:complete len:1007 (+),score=242.40 TRINITY_DN7826_c0_g2_i4:335-3022(+)